MNGVKTNDSEMGTYNFAFLGRYDQDIASKPA